MSPPDPRTLLRTREITCTGYLRDDGLLEIEGQLSELDHSAAQRVSVRLTVGMDLSILGSEVTMEPDGSCAKAAAVLGGLPGQTLRKGFREAITERLRDIQDSEPLIEFLGQLAVTAIQSQFALDRARRNGRRPEHGEGPMPKPALIGSCHTYRIDSEVVKVLWPPHRRMAGEDR